MPANIGGCQASQEVMLSNRVDTSTCRRLVMDVFAINSECEDFSSRVDIVVMRDLSYEGLTSLIKFPNNHCVYDCSCNIWVGVRRHAWLIFKNISSVKEFTNVTPNMEVDKKLAAWVFWSELPHIEYHVIEENKFFTSSNHLVKFLPRDSFLDFFEGLFFALVNLETDLKN